MKAKLWWASGIALLMLIPALSWAQGIPMVNVSGSGKDTQYSLSLQLLALMTTLTLLPSLLLMMTSFVRIIIVMSISTFQAMLILFSSPSCFCIIIVIIIC